MKLSDNLKSIRKENNLSQEQLAEKLGVSRQAVSKWESGQSYPEMDKVLLICKLFNYSIDELMNENIKEVDETKQSKNNFNKYVEDFFNFITKTVDMLSSMTFKQKIKCLIEQVVTIIILLCIFAIIGGIGSMIITGLIGRVPNGIYYNVKSICESIYILLALAIGIAIFLHIFKIRYLDYYEIVKEENIDNEEPEKTIYNEKHKIFIEKKQEKIVIRDPEHSQSKFLNGIIRIVLWCIKFIAIFIAITFAFSFISIVTLLVLSFLFVKTGLLFFGSLLGITSALIINYIILELLYNFIVSKKSKKSRMAYMLLASLILAGISIGLISIGITEFNYIENSEKNYEIEETYNLQMTENLKMGNRKREINYIETDSDEVKFLIKHSKYCKIEMNNYNGLIYFFCYQDDSKIMEMMRQTIEDINNKQIVNYDDFTIYVYTSKENIEKIKM